MKSKISTFLLGILVTICIGAGVSNSELLTVKPATPKITVVKIIDNYKTEEYIKSYIKKGYIFKSGSITADRNGGSSLIIMEKY